MWVIKKTYQCWWTELRTIPWTMLNEWPASDTADRDSSLGKRAASPPPFHCRWSDDRLTTSDWPTWGWELHPAPTAQREEWICFTHQVLPGIIDLGTFLLTTGNTWLARGNFRGTTHNTPGNYNTFLWIMIISNTARTSTRQASWDATNLQLQQQLPQQLAGNALHPNREMASAATHAAARYS